MHMADARLSYHSVIRRYHPLPRSEQEYLWRRVAVGDESARELAILSNLRIVLHLANRWDMGNNEDMIGYGIDGLISCVDRYKPMGYSFYSYAKFWVEQAFIRHEGERLFIRLPADKKIALKAAQRIIDREYVRTGFYPTSREVTRDLNGKAAGLTADLLERLLVIRVRQGYESLNTWADHGTRESLVDLVQDPNAMNPYQFAVTEERKRILQQQIRRLSERHQAVLTMRFGLEGHPALTLRAAAERLGVKFQRVAANESDALEILRRRMSRMLQ